MRGGIIEDVRFSPFLPAAISRKLLFLFTVRARKRGEGKVKGRDYSEC